jgi:hypothetical protein
MLRFSIGKMMLVIGGLACFFALVLTFERANRTFVCGRYLKCANNLRNVALAVLGYEYKNGVLPEGTWPNRDLDPASRLSWCARILPYLDEQEVYDTLEINQPWDSGENDVIAHREMRVLSCPARAPVAAGAAEATSFVGIAGLGAQAPSLPKSDRRAGVFGYERQTTIADIKDGTANTMLLVETGQAIGSWLQGGRATVRGLDPAQKPYIGNGRQFGGMHGKEAFVAFADGSVRRVTESVDPQVFEALSTMAGGERLPKDW